MSRRPSRGTRRWSRPSSSARAARRLDHLRARSRSRSACLVADTRRGREAGLAGAGGELEDRLAGLRVELARPCHSPTGRETSHIHSRLRSQPAAILSQVSWLLWRYSARSTQPRSYRPVEPVRGTPGERRRPPAPRRAAARPPRPALDRLARGAGRRPRRVLAAARPPARPRRARRSANRSRQLGARCRARPPRAAWSARGRRRPGARGSISASSASVAAQPPRRLERDQRLVAALELAPQLALLARQEADEAPAVGRQPGGDQRRHDRASGPGSTSTGSPASTHARTSTNPGSETAGVPASLTSATTSPACDPLRPARAPARARCARGS